MEVLWCMREDGVWSGIFAGNPERGRDRLTKEKNAEGIWVIKTQILGVHCNVHGIAGWIGMLGGAQRRRRRKNNFQVVASIKYCSSIVYLS